MTDDEKDALLKEARKNRDKGTDFERENLDKADEDLRFIAGEQWHKDDLAQRKEDGRPALTINKMPQFVRQVTGDIRINSPSIKVLPADSGSDKAMARVYTGLIRNIENQSKAHRAYITAAESAARCGTGHFRIVTEFADDDTFDQDIRIKRITNPFAVVWDPSAEEHDKSDAGWCFVLNEIDIDAFKEKYPDVSTEGWATATEDYNHSLWHTDDTVTVAEYWRRERVKKRIALLGSGEVIDVTDLSPEQIKELAPTHTREVNAHKVVQYHIVDTEVLEGPDEWVGSVIPVIPVLGDEVHIGTRTVRHGIVRFAKDPQRMYNYWQTSGTETVALAPKAPYIGTDKQFEGHDEWADANVKNYSHLIYTSDPDAPGPPQRNAPPDFPGAAVNMSQIASEDMKATTGIYDASLGARGNETSGRAISLRQGEGDVGTFVYIDNLSSAIEKAGRILIQIIPKIYDSERVIRVLGEDGTEEMVPINKSVGMDADGEPILLNDMSVGKYDLVVKTGPSFSTRRLEASDSMKAFIQAYPQAAPIIGDLIAENEDWPMSEEIAARLKRAIPPGLIDDEPQPPDPAMAAKVEKDRAAAAKSLAEAEGKELENLQTQLLLSMISDGTLQAAMAPIIQEQLQQLSPQQAGMPTAG